MQTYCPSPSLGWSQNRLSFPEMQSQHVSCSVVDGWGRGGNGQWRSHQLYSCRSSCWHNNCDESKQCHKLWYWTRDLILEAQWKRREIWEEKGFGEKDKVGERGTAEGRRVRQQGQSWERLFLDIQDSGNVFNHAWEVVGPQQRDRSMAGLHPSWLKRAKHLIWAVPGKTGLDLNPHILLEMCPQAPGEDH